MKNKLMLLAAVAAIAFAANQAEARRAKETIEIDVVGDADVTIKGDAVMTDTVAHNGDSCESVTHEGPAYKCPNITCPVCPKVECVASMKSNCPGCHVKAKGGKCHGGSCRHGN